MYIYNKLYSSFFKNYKQDVLNKIGSLIRITDEQVLDVCLVELNRILTILDGRITSMLDIPEANRFPSSKQFNTLLANMDVDLTKLFAASKIVSQDAQNVVNYNSYEREGITKLLSNTQRKVYNAYIYSKSGIDGVVIIKEYFINNKEEYNISNDITNLNNVVINTGMQYLTLSKRAAINDSKTNPINTKFIEASHVSTIEQLTTTNSTSEYNLYPNTTELAIGSRWNVKTSPIHNIERTTESLKAYKKQLIYNNAAEVISDFNSCQFESVLTLDFSNTLHKTIERRFTETFNVPLNYVFVDRPNSIQDKFISTHDDVTTFNNPTSKIKLKIPFNTELLASGLSLTLVATEGYVLPKLLPKESFVITNGTGGLSNIVGVNAIDDDDFIMTDVFKEYKIVFKQIVVPQMLELIFVYNNESGWADIEYFAKTYNGTITKTINVNINIEDEEEANKLPISYIRELYVVVDDIGDSNEERNLAYNVLSTVKDYK